MPAYNKHSWRHTAASSGGAMTGIDSEGELDIDEMSAGVVDPEADSIIFNDADDSKTYEEAIADLMALQCGKGIAYSAGDFILDADGCDDGTIAVGDTLPFVDESAAGDPTVLTSLAALVTLIRGTTTGTGLTDNGSSVLAVSINGMTAKDPPVLADAIAINDSENSNVLKKVTLTNLAELLSAIGSRLADDQGSLFYEAAEIDFGSADAVDTKITDAIVAKGKLVAVQAVVTEAFNGDADNTITISSAAGGATAMASTIVVDKDAGENGNYVGSSFGVLPNSDNSEIVASGGDVYAYRAANSNCSQGKLYFVLTFMKTA